MDLIFGTYVCPDHEPESLGLNAPAPKTWLGFMIQPLLPKRRKVNPEVPREEGEVVSAQEK